MTKLVEIVDLFENYAPSAWQESYDNSGLVTGEMDMTISKILITLDVTEAVVDEAIEKQCNMIISHHPLIFKGVKSLTGGGYIERSIVKAIKNDIAIYSAHTNIDSVPNGVSGKMYDILNLKNRSVLSPKTSSLIKLISYIPEESLATVREALFSAGAGKIGLYDNCSYSSDGEGTFRANKECTPYVGNIGELHKERECRLEVIVERYKIDSVVKALKRSHPYEEVAYDITPIENSHPLIGIGMVGELEEEVDELTFLNLVKEKFKCPVIKHSPLFGKRIKRVALCGGSGSSLINRAISSSADIYITGDITYHQFFDTKNRIIIADIGHYESEQFSKELFYDILIKKFPNFAILLSEVNSNPVNCIV